MGWALIVPIGINKKKGLLNFQYAPFALPYQSFIPKSYQ